MISLIVFALFVMIWGAIDLNYINQDGRCKDEESRKKFDDSYAPNCSLF